MLRVFKKNREIIGRYKLEGARRKLDRRPASTELPPTCRTHFQH